MVFKYETHSPVTYHGLLFKLSCSEHGIVFWGYPAKLRLTQKAIVCIHCPRWMMLLIWVGSIITQPDWG